MCCLFGILDYKSSLTSRERNRLLGCLAASAEARGTDATGIAYVSSGRLRVFKRPVRGSRMWFRVPPDANMIIGHTRMTTQGDEIHNQNNHPFRGKAGGDGFALAHNGVIRNDKLLRKQHKLPATSIETDSYIVVQLLNQGDGLSAKELARTAEQLEGTFTMTILHERENAVSFIRGDNPLCIYHYPKFGIYVYASTEQILCKALKHFRKELGAPEKVPTFCGDILRINVDGTREKAEFDDRNLWFCPYAGWSHWAEPDNRFPLRSEPRGVDRDAEYLAELKSMASIFGYYPEDIDMLLEEGVTVDEIEELLYSGQF